MRISLIFGLLSLLGSGCLASAQGPIGNQPSTGTSAAPPPRVTTAEAGGFMFESVGCQRRSASAVCVIRITNLKAQASGISIEVRNPGNSLLVDDRGDSLTPAGAWFAGRGGAGFDLPFQLQHIMPSRVPLNLTLQYDGLATDADTCTIVLDFGPALGADWYGMKQAILRDLPIY